MCRRRTVYGLWVYALKTRSRSASDAAVTKLLLRCEDCVRDRAGARFKTPYPRSPHASQPAAAPSVLSLPSELLHSLPEPRTLTCEILRIKPLSLFSKFHRLANIQLKSLPKQLMIFSVIIYRNNFCT